MYESSRSERQTAIETGDDVKLDREETREI